MSESQAHQGIQCGRCDRSLQCENLVQYTAHYIGCEGNQQAIQDGKHVKHFHVKQDVSNTMTTDRSWDSRGTTSERISKILFMEFVKKQPSASFLFFVLWNFIKRVIAVQSTNNVKCVRRVKGHGRKKKLLFPSGRKSKERSAIVPACLIDFFKTSAEGG